MKGLKCRQLYIMAFGVWCSSDRLNLVEFWCVSRGPAPAVLYRRCFRYMSQWIRTDQEPAEHRALWLIHVWDFTRTMWFLTQMFVCLHVCVHQAQRCLNLTHTHKHTYTWPNVPIKTVHAGMSYILGIFWVVFLRKTDYWLK